MSNAYKILKKDFIPKDSKSILNYELPSGKAYFLEDSEKNIVYASDAYVRKHFSRNDRGHVIDFTKGLIATFEKDLEGGTSKKGNGENHINNSKERDYRKALLYLFFYVEKMSNFKGFRKNTFLENVYSHYRESNFLSPKQIECVLKIERKYSQEANNFGYFVFSLKNIITCYAYEYKIKRAIDELNDKDRDFLKSILNFLYENLYLTDKQIDGVRKWFAYLPKELKEAKLKDFDKKV